MKIGVVALTTTLMLAGASHAAEKIALICSDAKGKDDYSLSIDLDLKLASFHMSDLPDADDVPVTRVTENYIWFQNTLAMEDREVVSRSRFCHQTKRDADRGRRSNPTAGGQSDS